MPSTGKSNRRGTETTEKNSNRKNRLTERAVSFHGGRILEQMTPPVPAEPRMLRPKTLPNLLAGRSSTAAAASSVEIRPLKLTKLLLNVTVQGSVGAVQVLISPESTVGDLIAAVIRQYNKEGRRPVLSTDPSRFGLHYSQFSLESLERAEKLQELGSRNYFMCQRKALADSGKKEAAGGGGGVISPPCSSSSSSCSTEVEKANRSGFPWLKFIDFRQ